MFSKIQMEIIEKNTNKFNTKFTLIGGGIEYIFLR